MSGLEQLFSTWLFLITIGVLRYLVAAGALFLLVGLLIKRGRRHRKIQNRQPMPSQLRREFMYSMSTVLIFSIVTLGAFMSPLRTEMRIYTDLSDLGVGYAVVSLIAVLVLHDAYFYWTHRLMHHPVLFRVLHSTHHRSRTPSAWAAYAFSPPEALVHAAFFPLVVIWLPMHTSVVFAFMIIMVARNAAGHCGFELFPNGLTRGWCRWSTTVTHHDLHHLKGKGNYGLYFMWWDWLMNTAVAHYEAAFDRVTVRD